MIQTAMAKPLLGRGITTFLRCQGAGYYERRFFERVDHVFTCSQFPDQSLPPESRTGEHADRAADRMVFGARRKNRGHS